MCVVMSGYIRDLRKVLLPLLLAAPGGRTDTSHNSVCHKGSLLFGIINIQQIILSFSMLMFLL